MIGLTTNNLLSTNGSKKNYLGAIFEAYVTHCIKTSAEATGYEVKFFRDSKGRHEIDIILENKITNNILAIEIKASSVPKDEDYKHLKWLRETSPNTVIDCMVIYAGERAYRNSEKIIYMPLGLLKTFNPKNKQSF